ncbi:hypothetical protein TPA0907_41120 [Micromonospora humidisoli]|uniref:hypothetical protein n=1 Tax=Micromonospora humidisoli TaxID=2807622 RepID=UPI001EF491BD|nr:hypothetical protein [Micromonospora humidisoli]GHJ09745.1 hypothetical protein TPA0907_41120 [Micromonospora sp. AKA109]
MLDGVVDLHTFAERPQGPLDELTRGQRQWTSLAEAKTSGNTLKSDQLEPNLDIARGQGLDALITISDKITPVPGQHPTTVDRRKLR